MPNMMPILGSAPFLHSSAGYIEYRHRLKGSCDDLGGGDASGVVSAWTALR